MRRHSALKVVTVATLGLICAPTPGVAQPRHGGYAGHVVVARPAPYYSPYYSPFYSPFLYDPFFYGAYQYPYPYGGVPYVAQSDLRFDMTPKEAAVYVDGYYAGVVEDFDGTFQRLHVEPGNHEIVVYLEGYRSRRERLYLGPNATRKLTGALEKLAPGQPNEPVPEPAGPPAENNNAPFGPAPQGRAPEGPQGPGAGRGAPPRGRADGGSVSIRVRPDNAEIVIDDEVWTGALENGELVVQLQSGRHHIEIRREGYRTLLTEIEVRSGQTTPLNINLTRAN